MGGDPPYFAPLFQPLTKPHTVPTIRSIIGNGVDHVKFLNLIKKQNIISIGYLVCCDDFLEMSELYFLCLSINKLKKGVIT